MVRNLLIEVYETGGESVWFELPRLGKWNPILKQKDISLTRPPYSRKKNTCSCDMTVSTGAIPRLANFKDLHTLHLSNNQLTGKHSSANFIDI